MSNKRRGQQMVPDSKILNLIRAGATNNVIKSKCHCGSDRIKMLRKNIFSQIGRPKITTPAVDNQIAKMASENSNASGLTISKDVWEKFQVKVSRSTVWRRLQSNNFEYTKPPTTPPIKKDNRLVRYNFCRKILRHPKAFIRKFAFSDESRIENRPDNHKRWMRRKNSRLGYYVSKPNKPIGIMVYGAIAYNCKSELVLVEGKINYLVHLQDVKASKIIEKCDSMFGSRNWYLVQDGAPSHTKDIPIKQLLQSVNIYSGWPANSPCLNPIEMVWAIIKKRLRKYQTNPKTAEELFRRVKFIWDTIPFKTINALIDSFHRRCKYVFLRKGAQINDLLRNPAKGRQFLTEHNALEDEILVDQRHRLKSLQKEAIESIIDELHPHLEMLRIRAEQKLDEYIMQDSQEERQLVLEIAPDKKNVFPMHDEDYRIVLLPGQHVDNIDLNLTAQSMRNILIKIERVIRCIGKKITEVVQFHVDINKEAHPFLQVYNCLPHAKFSAFRLEFHDQIIKLVKDLKFTNAYNILRAAHQQLKSIINQIYENYSEFKARLNIKDFLHDQQVSNVFNETNEDFNIIMQYMCVGKLNDKLIGLHSVAERFNEEEIKNDLLNVLNTEDDNVPQNILDVLRNAYINLQEKVENVMEERRNYVISLEAQLDQLEQQHRLLEQEIDQRRAQNSRRIDALMQELRAQNNENVVVQNRIDDELNHLWQLELQQDTQLWKIQNQIDLLVDPKKSIDEQDNENNNENEDEERTFDDYATPHVITKEDDIRLMQLYRKHKFEHKWKQIAIDSGFKWATNKVVKWRINYLYWRHYLKYNILHQSGAEGSKACKIHEILSEPLPESKRGRKPKARNSSVNILISRADKQPNTKPGPPPAQSQGTIQVETTTSESSTDEMQVSDDNASSDLPSEAESAFEYVKKYELSSECNSDESDDD